MCGHSGGWLTTHYFLHLHLIYIYENFYLYSMVIVVVAVDLIVQHIQDLLRGSAATAWTKRIRHNSDSLVSNLPAPSRPRPH